MVFIMPLRSTIQNQEIFIRLVLEIESYIMPFLGFFILILRKNLFLIHTHVRLIRVHTKPFIDLGSCQRQYQSIILKLDYLVRLEFEEGEELNLNNHQF